MGKKKEREGKIEKEKWTGTDTARIERREMAVRSQVLGPGRTAKQIVFHNRQSAASLVGHKTAGRQTNSTRREDSRSVRLPLPRYFALP